MSIAFSNERWERVKHNSRQWWAGKLKRPLINIYVGGRAPGRMPPSLPGINRATLYDLSVPTDAVIDRWDYDLSCQEYMGDAFPCIWPDMGPGCVAAFMPNGAAEPRSDTVWFHPRQEQEIKDIHFEYDTHNVYLKRLKTVCRKAMSRWGGLVQVSMTDLGGNLDILSTFRPSEKLLLDLYDHPDEVKRLTWEAHRMWWQCCEEINRTLQPTNPGYTAWTQIYSDVPYYILQCDFCYMIGPEMFDEFVKPELAASCKRLGNAFYHLDGPGQLPHLDSLLTIKELKGVQWVPGAGQPDQPEWPDVYRRIRKAGKLIQLFGDIHVLEKVAAQIGSAEGIIFLGSAVPEDKPLIEAFLRKYGAA